jgi:hypothetical protein
LEIHAPKAQTEEQRKVYEQMADAFDYSPRTSPASIK